MPESSNTINYDDSTADHFGDIRADLERKDAVIGVNDLDIAGLARSRGLIQVTSKTKEFEQVEGLRISDWTRDKFSPSPITANSTKKLYMAAECSLQSPWVCLEPLKR